MAIFCHMCGGEAPDGAAFCSRCGAALSGGGAKSPLAAHEPPKSEPPDNAPPRSEPPNIAPTPPHGPPPAARYDEGYAPPPAPPRYAARESGPYPPRGAGGQHNQNGGRRLAVIIAVFGTVALALTVVLLWLLLRPQADGGQQAQTTAPTTTVTDGTRPADTQPTPPTTSAPQTQTAAPESTSAPPAESTAPPTTASAPSPAGYSQEDLLGDWTAVFYKYTSYMGEGMTEYETIGLDEAHFELNISLLDGIIRFQFVPTSFAINGESFPQSDLEGMMAVYDGRLERDTLYVDMYPYSYIIDIPEALTLGLALEGQGMPSAGYAETEFPYLLEGHQMHYRVIMEISREVS